MMMLRILSNRFGLVMSGFLAFGLMMASGCDLFRKRKCEWYLVPDTSHRHLIDPGWVTLCARNYNLGKQKCGLKTEMKNAERWIDKPFRLKDLELEETVYPRVILGFKECSP